MPMFDIESGGKVNLTDCKTTSDQILKSSGRVDELTAERCESGSERSSSKPAWHARFFKFAFDNLTAITVGTIATVLGAAVVAYFNWS